jgi:hypothetical protein
VTGSGFAELTGAAPGEVTAWLGAPAAARDIGGDAWQVYELEQGSLRLRWTPAGGGVAEARIASWTLTLAEPASSLREATEPLGLWPAAAPDATAGEVRTPLVRRSLPAGRPGSGPLQTLTATVRYGAFTQVSVFDEAPDWL